MDVFFLGVHRVHWLWTTTVPLFVSARVLRGYKALRSGTAPWCLDSGGFSELSLHGRWTVPPGVYVTEVRRYAAEIGGLRWAAIQDWMTEIPILRKTGGSIDAHQRLTVRSFEELKQRAPDLPWLPVLQGQTVDDYFRHLDLYDDRGIRFAEVGIGSICRRQATREAAEILHALRAVLPAVRLHAFGLKKLGLRTLAGTIDSADSMAWSFRARRSAPLPGHGHKNCANCLDFALRWRNEIVGGLCAS